jgi:hypothetical protein
MVQPGVLVGSTGLAIFNEAMDAATINSSTIELRNASSALITAVISLQCRHKDSNQ